MACAFCATGQAGFDRHLDAGEILEQVLRAQHHCDGPLTNVVFMGMGEPLANRGPVFEALDRLHSDLGLSARRITVSTIGVVPGIRALDAAREHAARRGRRVTFEYACIAGVNDAPRLADALATRLRGFRGGAHVNLIPLNPTAGFPGRASGPARIAAFAARLRDRGLHVSVRANRGTRIEAACGQLRARPHAESRLGALSARMAP